MTDRYDTQITPDGTDALSRIARRIETGSTVLDVGAGPGVLGRHLTPRGITVDGLELDPGRVQLARPYYRNIIALDLETADLAQHLGEVRYEVIVCADVLEHLRDPGALLERLKPHLATNGRLLVSIPNVAYAGVLAALMAGAFPYAPKGLLDSTHVRFFTRGSLLELLETHGFGVASLEEARCPVNESEFAAFSIERTAPEVWRSIVNRPDGLTYQLIVEARTGVATPEALRSAQAPTSGIRLYWAAGSEAWDEHRSAEGRSERGAVYTFRLPGDLRGGERFRLDLGDGPGLLRIGRLEWSIACESRPAGIGKARHHVQAIELPDSALWLATGGDPWIELTSPGELGQNLELRAELAFEPSADVAERLGEIWTRSVRDIGEARSRAAAAEARARTLESTLARESARGGKLEAELRDRSAAYDELAGRFADVSRRLVEAEAPPPLRRAAREVRRAIRPYSCELLTAPVKSGLGRAPGWLELSPKAGRLPAGWVEVDFEISGTDGEFLLPRLFLDDGTGNVRESDTPLPEPAGGRSRGTIKLPDRVTQAFLDPGAGAGRYRVGRLGVRELSRPAAAVRLASPLAAEHLASPRRAGELLRGAWRLYRKSGWDILKRRFRDEVQHRGTARDYAAWLRRYDELSAADRAQVVRAAAELSSRLSLTVVLLAAADDPAAEVERTLESLNAIVWPRWRGVVLELTPGAWRAGASPSATLFAGGVCTTWEDLIARAPGPEGLALFVRPGDVLSPHAAWLMADQLDRHPEADAVYPDQDRLVQGERVEPWFKSDWSPHRFWSQDYVEHRLAARWRALEPLARKELEREPLYGALLRIGARGDAVRHVPHVLYHIGRDRPRDLNSARRQLGEALETLAPGAAIQDGRLPGTLRIVPGLPHPPPLSSLIVPTRNGVELLRRLVRSLAATTGDLPRELIVVDNGSDDPETLSFLRALEQEGRGRVLPAPGPFNFAALNNLAVREARGEVVVFINNDVEFDRPGWLEELVGWALRDEVGAVGCRLRYANGTLQHAGVAIGVHGLAAHVYAGLAVEAPGHGGDAWVLREVGAATAACLAMRRALYLEIGGMDERLCVSFNDVELCLRLRARGSSVLYTPWADALHLESASRGEDATAERRAATAEEARLVRALHGKLASVDPYYSPNLTTEGTDASLAFPPRVARPWRSAPLDRPRAAFLTYRMMKGYGVDVVVAEQVEFLCARGWSVTVHVLDKDSHYDERFAHLIDAGSLRISRAATPEAALREVELGRNEVVVAQTPPFQQLLQGLSDQPVKVLFDHGEPPADLFPADATERRAIAAAKVESSRHADLVVAISQFIARDSGLQNPVVCYNGNDHLLRRRSNLAALQGTFRTAQGLGEEFLVLNVTRFGEAERRYKGLEEYAAVREALVSARPDLARRVTFLVVGRSEAGDRAWAESRGLRPVSNLGDDELLAAYLDSDLYLSTSQWEGYNLGIAQALVLGLPALGSAKGAHPEFPINTSDSPAVLASWIAGAVERVAGGGRQPLRRLRDARVWPWKDSAARLESMLVEALQARGSWPASRGRPIARQPVEKPELSIIILDKDRPELLRRCLESIEEHCDVEHEVLIGDTGSTDPATLELYERTRHAVHHLGFYQFSACNNILAARARGRVLLFLNNDTEFIDTRFREALDYLASPERVGCVGAYLLYPDRRIQHAGVRICPEAPYRGIPEHFDRFKTLEGYAGLKGPREVVAVTGAMLLVARDVFESVGGFDEVYREEAQDIDLCLRLRQKGLRSIMHPALLAFHHENATRTVKEAPADRAEFLRRFGVLVDADLYAWQAERGL